MEIDQKLISHTANPHFDSLKHDKEMESIRDRRVYVDIPKVFEALPQLWGKFEQQVAYRYVEECVMYFNNDDKPPPDSEMLTDIEDAAKIPKEDRVNFRSQVIVSLFCGMHKKADNNLWFFMENYINVPKQLRNAITLYMFQPLMKS